MSGWPGMKRPRCRVTARARGIDAAARRIADDHGQGLALVEVGGGACRPAGQRCNAEQNAMPTTRRRGTHRKLPIPRQHPRHTHPAAAADLTGLDPRKQCRDTFRRISPISRAATAHHRKTLRTSWVNSELASRSRGEEDPYLVRGEGRLCRRCQRRRSGPRLCAAVPHSHASIVSIDVKRARQSPGVLHILAGNDPAALALGLQRPAAAQAPRRLAAV